VFLLSAILYLYFNQPALLAFGKDGFTLLGLGAILAGSGVPIGYLIHQISMFFGFVLRTKRNRYFKEEYDLDKLILNTENGDKIRTRYRHLLSRVHELRALKYSHIVSLVFIIFLEYFKYKEYKVWFWVLLGSNIFFMIIVHVNQYYFRDNLKFFEKKIKSSN
jgi:hypothetical protein